MKTYSLVLKREKATKNWTGTKEDKLKRLAKLQAVQKEIPEEIFSNDEAEMYRIEANRKMGSDDWFEVVRDITVINPF